MGRGDGVLNKERARQNKRSKKVNTLWYISFVQKRRERPENTMSTILNDCHPFEEMNRLNEEDEFYGYVLTFFKEISKKEYNMFLKGIEDQVVL